MPTCGLSVSRARISVCPVEPIPARNNAFLLMGPVTIPATFRSHANDTAFLMAVMAACPETALGAPGGTSMAGAPISST